MKSVAMALVAGSCLSAAAFGQALTPMGEGHLGPIYKIDMEEHPGRCRYERGRWGTRTGTTSSIRGTERLDAEQLWHDLRTNFSRPGRGAGDDDVLRSAACSLAAARVGATPASIQYKFYARRIRLHDNPMINAGRRRC